MLVFCVLFGGGGDDGFVDWISRPDDEVLYRRGTWHMMLLRSCPGLMDGRQEQTTFTVRLQETPFSVRP
jgi:hypothetical protein